MALPNVNISISLVQKTIGYGSNSLFNLVTNAFSGGTNGSAFEFVSGRTIPNSLPYWNKWAWNIPAEWTYDDDNTYLTLKTDIVNSPSGFKYQLGDFRGYNHDAIRPECAVPGSINESSGSITVGVLVNFHEWHFPFGIEYAKAVVTVGGSSKSLLMSITGTSTYWSEEVMGQTLTFNGVSSFNSGTVQLFLSNESGTEIAPMSNVIPNKSFTVTHIANYGLLSRMLAYPADDNITINANVYIPTGTGNIQIPVGYTELSGYVLRIVLYSTTISYCSFDIYLSQTDESNQYIGNYGSSVSSDGLGYVYDIYLDTITIAAVASGDNLGFTLENLTY